MPTQAFADSGGSGGKSDPFTGGKEWVYQMWAVHDDDDMGFGDARGDSGYNAVVKAIESMSVVGHDVRARTELETTRDRIKEVVAEAEAECWDNYKAMYGDPSKSDYDPDYASKYTPRVVAVGAALTFANSIDGELVYQVGNASARDFGEEPSWEYYWRWVTDDMTLSHSGKSYTVDDSFHNYDTSLTDFALYKQQGKNNIRVIVLDQTQPAAQGKIQVSKVNTSGSNELTEGNNCYSLAGAVYTIYSDSACTNAVGTITTDDQGNGTSADLTAGTYYVRETTASKGYSLAACANGSAHGVTVEAGKTVPFTCEEPPLSDPAAAQIQKVDLETGEASAQGAANLAGAEFTVKYYAIDPEQSYTQEELDKHAPTAVWVLKTNTNGFTSINRAYYYRNEYLASYSGHDIYTDNGIPVIPRGVITTQETKAPEGYNLPDNAPIIENITGPDSTKEVSIDNPTEKDSVKRGDFSFRKVDEETQEQMAGVQFKITSDTTGETHTVTTDADGFYSTSSSYASHSASNGVWFSGSADTTTEPDDSLGALPYDTYTVEELRSEANEGHNLVKFKVTISQNGYTKQFGSIDDTTTELTTEAVLTKTNGHYGEATSSAVIKDTIELNNLRKGDAYKLVTTLYDKETGKVIDGISEETEWTAKASFENKQVRIKFDASEYAGKSIVVFEQLYHNGEACFTEDDATNEMQTITFGKIGTVATDTVTGLHEALASDSVKLKDTVSYTGVDPFYDYTLYTEVYYTDGTSTGVTAETKVEPDKSGTGTVEVEADLSGLDLAGKSVVFFEKLVSEDETFTFKHEDLTDENQIVSFPKVETEATDVATGNHTGTVGANSQIKDVVTYTNLKGGTTYTISGTLMDKETGEAIVDADGNTITASTEFVADESGEGSVELTFTLNTSTLAGHKLVAFEKLFKGTAELADHEDIEDEEQTVEEPTPEVGTVAASGTNGEHTLAVGTTETVVDTVSYTGLVPGTTYTLKGCLVDKETGDTLIDAEGNAVAAEAEFVPETTDGTTEIKFTVDTTKLMGKSLVAFEDVFCGAHLIGSHKDITDEAQTVDVPELEIETTATDAADGDHEVDSATDTITINDAVKYENLVPGETYQVVGTLMDKSTGEPVKDANGNVVTSSVEFVPEASSGEVVISFTFNPLGYAPSSAVAFEELYCQGTLIAEHKDIDDEDQTVNLVVDVDTTAVDSADGDHEIDEAKDAVITDTVDLKGLVAGNTYRLIATLMDKDANEAIELQSMDSIKFTKTSAATTTAATTEAAKKTYTLQATITNADGTSYVFGDGYDVAVESVEGTNTFSYNDKDGAVHTLSVTTDAATLKVVSGTKTTIEKLDVANVAIAEIVKSETAPAATTEAATTDVADTEKADEEASTGISDYKVEANGVVTFKATAATAKVEVPIGIKADQITGSDLVVFEKLELAKMTTAEDGTVTAAKDTYQVKLTDEEGKTTIFGEGYELVVGKSDEGNTIYSYTDKDKVAYTLTDKGETFELTVVNGEETTTTEYKKDQVSVSEVKAIQAVYEHADIDDADQTISVKKTPAEKLVQTGLNSNLPLIAGIGVLVAAVITVAKKKELLPAVELPAIELPRFKRKTKKNQFGE